MKHIFELAQKYSTKRDPNGAENSRNNEIAASDSKLIKLDDQSSEQNPEPLLQNPELLEQNRIELLSLLKELKLRYFSPLEIARILGFPAKGEMEVGDTETKFEFPAQYSANSIQAYRVLGNSLSVTTVSFLTTLLFQQS